MAAPDVVEADRRFHIAGCASMDHRVAGEVEHEKQPLPPPYPELAGGLADVSLERAADLADDPENAGIRHVNHQNARMPMSRTPAVRLPM